MTFGMTDSLEDTDELCALVLDWTKAHHPTFYADTLAVIGNTTSFRKHLIRLVEIRFHEEPAWRRTVPLRILELTAVTVSLRCPATGLVVTCGGTKAKSRQWSFQLLSMLGTNSDAVTMLRATAALDLAVA